MQFEENETRFFIFFFFKNAKRKRKTTLQSPYSSFPCYEALNNLDANLVTPLVNNDATYSASGCVAIVSKYACSDIDFISGEKGVSLYDVDLMACGEGI